MTKKEVAIIIPVYKETLNETEIISFKQTFKILKDYQVFLCGPSGLKLDFYKKLVGEDLFVYQAFSEKYFENVRAYSRLLMLPKFYRSFKEYQFLLICQTDVFLFKDDLLKWTTSGWDYVGSPWIDSAWITDIKVKIPNSIADWFFGAVGNGGFSLRRTNKFIRASLILLPFSYLWPLKWNEDSYWSNLVPKIWPGFKIPEIEEALKFGFEENPSKAFKMNNYELPFGCHAFEKYEPDFWKKFIPF